MKRKTILIANAFSIFPKTMANQDRIFNMVKRLAQAHIVDFVTPVRNEVELTQSMEHLKPVCRRFFPIVAINPTNNHAKRKFHRLMCYLRYYLFSTRTNTT